MGWGKSTQLGHGLGLIMGAKLAEPDKLCINIMGDAAIGMVGMDIETVVRLSTLAPAQSIRRDHLCGRLSVGAPADIAVFRVNSGQFTFEDPQGEERDGAAWVENTHTVAGGVLLDRSRDPLADRPFPMDTI